MTAPTTPAPPAPDPRSTPSYWEHYVNIVLQAAAFITVAVAPGWNPPVSISVAVAVICPLLAFGSALFVGISKHRLTTAGVTAEVSGLLRQLAGLHTVSTDRLGNIEGAIGTVARILASSAAPSAPQTAAGGSPVIPGVLSATWPPGGPR